MLQVKSRSFCPVVGKFQLFVFSKFLLLWSKMFKEGVYCFLRTLSVLPEHVKLQKERLIQFNLFTLIMVYNLFIFLPQASKKIGVAD
jgi:hypothetical protein